MLYHLKYHNGLRAISIPEKAKATLLQPAATAPRQLFSEMLAVALNTAQLEAQLRRSAPKRIAIAIPDATQPLPTLEILPILLRKLFDVLPGLEPAAVTLIIATGVHPPPTREAVEKLRQLDGVRHCNVVAHDAHASPMSDCGTTRRGTPVRINAAYSEAPFKIVLGLIEPHLFFGLTDASKTAVMGCGAADTIRRNHGLIHDSPTGTGSLRATPMGEDLTEAGRMAGIDFAVSVVLNADGQAVHLLAGRPEDLLEPEVAACSAVYGVALRKKYDIILASCAGYRKELSAQQALKGFNRASQAVKKGGKILLLVASRKGFGEDVYFDYVCPYADPQMISQELITLGSAMGEANADRFGATIVIGPTDELDGLDAHIMRHCHLRAADPSTIMEEWVDDYEGIPEVAVIPHAMTTFFYNR